MTRSTVTALRLVPALGDFDPVQQELPGLHLEPAGEPDEGFGLTVVRTPPQRGSRTGRFGAAGLRSLRARTAGERGMATAEYAVGLIAACAFALVLYKVVTGTPIFQLLNELAQRALNIIAL